VLFQGDCGRLNMSLVERVDKRSSKSTWSNIKWRFPSGSLGSLNEGHHRSLEKFSRVEEKGKSRLQKAPGSEK
jgi:hypothetical protein